MRLSRRLMRKRPVRGFRVGGGGHEVDGVRPAAVFSFWFFKTFGKGGLKMNDDVKQAILLAIDALESCCDDWVYDDRNGREYLVRDFDGSKVSAALKALQALPWEEE